MAELEALEEMHRLQLYLKRMTQLKQLQDEMTYLEQLKLKAAMNMGKPLETKATPVGSCLSFEFQQVFLLYI